MFTMENTQGYTQAQLDELNRRLALVVTTRMDPSERDRHAEQVLAEYDTELSV